MEFFPAINIPHSASFWSLVAFLLAFGLAIGPLVRSFRSALKNSIAVIQKSVNDAEHLSQEAANLLAQLEEESPKLEQEAKNVVTDAHHVAQSKTQRMQQEMNDEFERRKRDTIRRLQRMETDAIMNIQNKMIAIAYNAATQIIEQKLTAKQDENNNNNFIQHLQQSLNG